MRRPPPTDPEVVHREMTQLVDTLINNELIYQAALKDTAITVSPIEVSDAVDATMRDARRQFPTEQAFQRELRGTGFLGIDDYRRWLTDQQLRELLRSRFEAKLRSDGTLVPVPPTEREIRAYYDARRASLPPRPPSASLRQIVIRAGANPEAKAAAFRTADSLAKAIRAGADFAVAARRFSQDPASGPNGGELDWFRRGQMVREFEQVAFSLPRGTISDPVESPFGYHIIQVERTSATEVKARHILISPAVDSSGIRAAHAKADSLRALVLAGASFDSLQSVHHDPAEVREAQAVVVDSLGPQYAAAIEGVAAGDVTEVFELSVPGSPDPPKFAFVRVTARLPAGPVPYDQVREQIRLRLADAMGQEKYYAELRRKTHVEVRPL